MTGTQNILTQTEPELSSDVVYVANIASATAIQAPATDPETTLAEPVNATGLVLAGALLRTILAADARFSRYN